MNDFIDPSGGYGRVLCQPVLRDGHGRKEFFLKNFPRMDRIHFLFVHGLFPLMVVNDFDLVCASISPDKANSPLSIDSNAVLSFSIPMQTLELVFRGYFQVFEPDCCIDHPELTESHVLDVMRQST
jgi:hypothetical protein